MAGSLNKVMLIGKLGKDPEIRTMASGDRVASFSVATSESWKDKKSGERKEKTEWHRVSIFNDGLVTIADKYLEKGSSVYLEGQLQTREWEKDGVKHSTTEIVLQKFNGVLTMLGSKPQGGGKTREPDRRNGESSYAGASRGSGARERFDLDDDIPFISSASIW